MIKYVSIDTTQYAWDTYAFTATVTVVGATVTNYLWNFGDGSAATGQLAVHRFGDAGTYTVIVKVVDSKCKTAIKSVTVLVVAPIPPPPPLDQDGVFEVITNNVATGWSTRTVTLWVDGSLAQSVTPSLPRQDVLVTHPNYPLNTGWQATLQLSSGTHTVVAKFPDSTSVSGSPKTATGGSSPPPIEQNGNFESLTDNVATGWSTYDVTLLIDGVLAQTVTPNLPRSDVVASHPTYPTNTGWQTTLPISVGTHTVVAKFPDGSQLTGSPRTEVNSEPPPPPLGDRVQTSIADTNFMLASKALRSAWAHGGGDWLDKNGDFNGPVPTISKAITANVPTDFDISMIHGDLLLTGIFGWANPLIDGNPAAWFGMDASSDQSQNIAHWNNPGIILNPTRGRILTLTPNAYLPSAEVLRIDQVAGPIIDNLPYVGPTGTANVWELDLTSDAVVTAAAYAPGRIDLPIYVGGGTYSTDEHGINYVRTKIPAGYNRNISWRLPYGAEYEELWTRYMVLIEDDVVLGITDGMKMMAGMSNETMEQAPDREFVVYRLDHGLPSIANPGLYAMIDYLYDAEAGVVAVPEGRPLNALVRTGRWYVIECHLKMNTPGISNGIGEIKVNGHLTWTTTTARYRNSGLTKINNFFANHYHGGHNVPSRDIHYRFAKFAASATGWCGVPTELLVPTSTYPAWRNAMTVKDTVYEIPGTANMNGQTALVAAAMDDMSAGTNQSAPINLWNGLAATADAFYALAGGGHEIISWSNAVYKFPFDVDAPQWQVKNYGSKRSACTGHELSSYYADGLLCARHDYYSPQWVAQRNRIFLVTQTGSWTDGNAGSGNLDGYNPDTNLWDPAGTWATCPNRAIAQSTVTHPVTGDIYTGLTSQLFKWTQASNTWSQPAALVWGMAFNPTILDATRNRLMNFGSHSSVPTEVYCYDLTSFALTVVNLTGTVGAVGYAYSGGCYDSGNDRYLLQEGTAVLAVNPDTWVTTQIATVPAPANGCHNRFAYFARYGGVAYLPSYESNMLFIPTR